MLLTHNYGGKWKLKLWEFVIFFILNSVAEKKGKILNSEGKKIQIARCKLKIVTIVRYKLAIVRKKSMNCELLFFLSRNG